MKKALAFLISIITVFSLVGCDIDSIIGANHTPGTTNKTTTTVTEPQKNQDLESFYDKVCASQQLLDTVADAIYRNWYDAIYKDKFGESIDLAIAMAQIEHSDDIEKIEALDAEIAALFKTVKASEQASLIKEIMSAYSDYYEFVINVSGSFNSYSADKETLKKELASLLRDLSYEL